MGYNSERTKMRIFLWVWRFIGPLVFFMGFIYFAFVLFNPDWTDDVPMGTSTTCILGGICAVIGIILGFTGWAEDVAPRMFWVKSRLELMDSKVGYALTLGIQMFFLPAAIVITIALLSAA